MNPEYDETQTYIPRSERKKWSPVGMLGMLRVRDDGTCKVGGYCKPNEKGIATSSESGYYITNRYSKNIIEVFLNKNQIYIIIMTNRQIKKKSSRKALSA